MKAKYIVFGIIIALFLKLFVLDIMTVEGTSMEDAIKNGSVIFINKLAYGPVIPFGSRTVFQWKKPRRGEAVIYLYNNKTVVKRCIAEELTLLEYYADSEYNLEYYIKVNGEKIPLTEMQYHKLSSITQVPEKMIFCVGDNYNNSVDSRDYGFVPVENVLGRVIGK